MTVVWARRAVADMASIYAYLAAESEEAALRISDRLYEAGQSLEHLPQRGRLGRVAETRELIVDPYVITYRIRRDEIHILHVEHGARRR